MGWLRPRSLRKLRAVTGGGLESTTPTEPLFPSKMGEARSVEGGRKFVRSARKLSQTKPWDGEAGAFRSLATASMHMDVQIGLTECQVHCREATDLAAR